MQELVKIRVYFYCHKFLHNFLSLVMKTCGTDSLINISYIKVFFHELLAVEEFVFSTFLVNYKVLFIIIYFGRMKLKRKEILIQKRDILYFSPSFVCFGKMLKNTNEPF